MVYQLTPEQVRHADWALRLDATGTDRVVESHRIACSHFDAYMKKSESFQARDQV